MSSNKIESFVVINNGIPVASYSTALPFGEYKAFQFAKQNMVDYGGIILARDAEGNLNSVEYKNYKSEEVAS